MTNKFNKDQLQTLVLGEIMDRPYQEFNGCKVHHVAEEYEALFVKNLQGNREVKTLNELEDAMNTPDVKTIYIGKNASITSKALENVLEHSSLVKQIFSAIEE